MNFVRTLVSKKKRRFQKEGFDLDLTYITDRIIAMGYPAEGLEALYRNKLVDIVQFLVTLHKDHFKVYNLCSERTYVHSKFPGPVKEFPFDDHNPPSIKMVKEFCDDVRQWLDKDPFNVVCIHCKAGKGRTGTMICCYMLYADMARTASEALTFYGNKRTFNGKGVTIPSQRRYVEYWAQIVHPTIPFSPDFNDRYIMESIRMNQVPYLGKKVKKVEPWIAIHQSGKTVYYAKPSFASSNNDNSTVVKFDFHGSVVSGDIKIELFNRSSKHRLFWCWFNTAFIPRKQTLVFMKDSLDKACKDVKHKMFKINFKVDISLQKIVVPKDPPRISASDDNFSRPSSHASFGLTTVQRHLVCADCRLFISEASISYKGSNYHWDCLKCDNCGNPFAGTTDECVIDHEINTNGKLLCTTCTKTPHTFLESCVNCARVIKDDNFCNVKSLGLLCQKCFMCRVCNKYFDRPDHEEYEEGENDFIVIGKKLVCSHHSVEKIREIYPQYSDVSVPSPSQEVPTEDIDNDDDLLEASVTVLPSPARPRRLETDPIPKPSSIVVSDQLPSEPEAPPPVELNLSLSRSSPYNSLPKRSSTLVKSKSAPFPPKIESTEIPEAHTQLPAIEELFIDEERESAYLVTENLEPPIDLQIDKVADLYIPPVIVRSNPITVSKHPSQNRGKKRKVLKSKPLSQHIDNSGESVKPNSLRCCSGCGQAINREHSFIRAQGREYHMNCFVCSYCNKPIGATYFGFDPQTKAVYCESHYMNPQTTVCYKCRKPIFGNYLMTRDGFKVHTECLVCSNCDSIIGTQVYYLSSTGLPLCNKCKI